MKEEEKAKDIDILIVLTQKENNKINKLIKERNLLLTKKIHPIKQTEEDLIKNLKKPDKVVLNAVKDGIVLHGYEKLIEVITDVQNR